MFLNLGLLGLNVFLCLFDIAISKENLSETLDESEKNSFSEEKLLDGPKNSNLDKLKIKNKEDIFLTLKIFADKQYAYDKDIYLAEGNVKVLVNGGILRADSLRYEKLTGILSAEGNVRFTKGDQYFRGKEFRFNLLNREGFIKEVYGILDIENVLEDLKIDSNSEEIVLKNSLINKLNNKEKNIYNDGIEFSVGNIKLPQNKITRSNKSIGAINNWRFKSDLITIQENGWKSNKINFTNDPFDPHQISFEAIDVIAEDDDDKLLVTSSKTNLILANRTRFFLGKRIFGGKERKSKLGFIYDGKDRDGLALIRKSDTTKINNNVKLDLQPQFLINRAILGKTNSYKNNNINFSDLFGLNAKLNAYYKDWTFDSVNDLSTLNTSRLFSGLRHTSSLRKYIKMPIIDDSSFNIFTAYRSRAWNGTLGETEIKSAYGFFIEKNQHFKYGELKNNLELRFGTGKYEAEKLGDTEIITLLRSSIFGSIDSEYEIWKKKQNNLDSIKESIFSPILINPELVLKSNINSAYFKYEDGNDQIFLKLSLGPEIRLGELKRKFLDYTKLSVMPGIKFKNGDSPFKFDNAVDLKTVNLSFMQQIYGPLMLDIISNLNIDNSSENYGEYYDTKLGLLWHKRAYEFGIYYHPDNDAGGIYFRLNGFDFANSTNPVF